MEFKIASNASQREAAFRLVHHRYVQANLDEDNSYGMRVTPHHLLRTSTVFVGLVEGEVVTTMTLVEDGALGLPMEAMYGEEVERRRRLGLQLSEVTCFADRRKDIRRFLDAFRWLIHLVAEFARHRGVDEILAAVHPRHAPFYRRYMGFEQMAGLSTCPHVNHNPSVGLVFSFARCDELPPRCYDAELKNQISNQLLSPPSMTSQERSYLESVCAETQKNFHHLTAWRQLGRLRRDPSTVKDNPAQAAADWLSECQAAAK